MKALLAQSDRRVLASLLLEDLVSGLPVRRGLQVFLGERTLPRNRRGFYIVEYVPGLESHGWRFEMPPALPPVGNLRVSLLIQDELGHYLPRRYTLALPRDPDPAHRLQSDSLFQPARVRLYPAPSAPARRSWSLVRISVSRSGKPLAGVLFRVRGEGRVWGSGISDLRGEALLVVAGVPVTRFASGAAAEGAVLTRELQLVLEASWLTDETWPVDPDELERAHEGNGNKYTQPLTLVAGRSEWLRLELN